MVGPRSKWQVAWGILLVGLLAPLLIGADILPSELIDRLNQVRPSQLPINPAEPMYSPLDQARPQEPAKGEMPPAMAYPVTHSKLEADYSRRAGTALTQFGYDTFRTISPSTGQIQNGAVADNYRLNIGDDLIITLRGQDSRSLSTRVDREGHIVIPELPPLAAAGKTFGEFRAELERQVATTFINTQVFVSVGTVRQIAVAVLGETNAPGIYRMGGFATVLDALAAAGGVKKTGTLRRIILRRGAETSIIDLYDLLVGISGRSDFSLADGDRIVIPPIGPTVAIAGDIDRPGIYELPASRHLDDGQIDLLAGSPLQPAGNRYLKFSLDNRGRDVAMPITSLAQASLRAGDILMIMRENNNQVGSVRLEGAVRVPGLRSLALSRDVRALIGSYDTFLDNPYLLFGAIRRIDPMTRARVLIPINLYAIMRGTVRVPLRDGDTVIVLGAGDVNYIGSGDVQAVLLKEPPPSAMEKIVTVNPRGELAQTPPPEEAPKGLQPGPPAPDATGTTPQSDDSPATAAQQEIFSQKGVAAVAASMRVPAQGRFANLAQICRGLQSLAVIVDGDRAGRFANAILRNVALNDASHLPTLPNNFLCPPIFDTFPDLLPLTVEHVAALQGEVHAPGLYPVLPGTPLAAAVAEAGGLSREVDLQRVEVSHYAIDNARGDSVAQRHLVRLDPRDMERLAVGPGDVIRFNPVFVDRDNGPVVLRGEFRLPGTYQIRRGERLSSVIARAGGLTEQAYPYGAVYTRLSVSAKERDALNAAANQVESGLTTALAHTSTSQDAQSIIQAAQLFAGELRSSPAVGRMVVEADPTVLKVKPQLDVILEPGDTIAIPKRPSTVAVSGEVLHPTSLQFMSGETPKDYIRQAGGFTESADDGDTFVILPNGQAETIGVSFWNYTPIMIPPGSTIVVPKELRPFDLTSFLKDSTQIFSNLAISAAALAVIHSTAP